MPATPKAPARRASTAPETAPAAPRDPGPRPAIPGQPVHSYASDAANRLYRAARMEPVSVAREHVLGVPTLREPPAVARWKADLLDWCDRAEAWDAAKAAR